MLLVGRIGRDVLVKTSFVILVLLCGFVTPPAFAGREKQASFVIDGNSGAVLHEQAADEPRFPASLTKMMTLYLAFEEIASGRMTEDTMLTVSMTAASMSPSKLGLEVGERISLGHAMKAVVTKSANDMACAIAEAIAGSEEAFARRMTQRARQIGMSSTTFRNASGLPDPGQITTARDMVTLGLRLRDDFPQQFALFQTRTFSYGGKTYKNHNTLMNGFGGMDGIKTGYTRASGFNLVSSVQRDGKYVVGAVFGGVSASVRNAHMRVLLFRALGNASTEKTRKSKPMLVARGPVKAVNPQAVAQTASKQRPSEPAPKPVAARKAEKKKDVAVAQAPAAPAPAVAATSDGSNQADPSIKIAKVKPVMVAGQPTATPDAAGAQPRARPQFVTASSAPRFDLGSKVQPTPGAAAAPAPLQQAQSNESIVSKGAASVRQPGTLNSQVAALRSDDGGLQAARGILGEPAAPRAEAAKPSSRSADPAVGKGAGGYLIQVGAFASEGEATKHLEEVRGRASDLLRDRTPRAEQATVGSRQVYRARFAEFDSASANAACASLRQKKVDCMVLRAP